MTAFCYVGLLKVGQTNRTHELLEDRLALKLISFTREKRINVDLD